MSHENTTSRSVKVFARIFTTLAMLGIAAAPSVVSAQSAIAPATTATSAVRMRAPLAGVYQIGMSSGTMVIPARLIVEQTTAGINAMILTPDGSISALKDIVILGNTLQATVLTDTGAQRLNVRISGEKVEGTLGAGTHSWLITGTKTA